MATKKKNEGATPPADEAGGRPQKKNEGATPPGSLPEALDQSFKDNTALKVAYVAGKNFFFDERLAKSQFDSYQKVDNPYAEPEPAGEDSPEETE